MTRESVVWAAHDRLLADLAEFLTRYAWTGQHDESQALYERIKMAREHLASQRSSQGATR